MGTEEKKLGILTLSAATAALLQSSICAESKPTTEGTDNPSGASIAQVSANTNGLILDVPDQKELLRLYADHSSHASHSSHVSGMGGDDSYPAPYYPPPVTPVYPSTPPPVAPAATITPAAPAASVTRTNDISAEAAANAVHIKTLTEEAATGSAYAQYSLGICYLYGSDGVKPNIDRAKMLLELSAVQGNDYAKQKLAELNSNETKPPASGPIANLPPHA